MLHDIHVVSHSFITFNNLFKLITKIRAYQQFILIYKLNRHKIQVLIWSCSKIMKPKRDIGGEK